MSIQNWQQHRMIPNKVKWIATLSLITSFSISAMLLTNGLLLSLLAVSMSALLAYLLSRSSKVDDQLGIYTTSYHVS